MYKLILALIIIIIIIIIVVVAVKMYSALPDGVVNGDTIKCATAAPIYKVENNQKRWYPNPTIYSKYGSPAAKVLSCDAINKIPNGPNMA